MQVTKYIFSLVQLLFPLSGWYTTALLALKQQNDHLVYMLFYLVIIS